MIHVHTYQLYEDRERHTIPMIGVAIAAAPQELLDFIDEELAEQYGEWSIGDRWLHTEGGTVYETSYEMPADEVEHFSSLCTIVAKRFSEQSEDTTQLCLPI